MRAAFLLLWAAALLAGPPRTVTLHLKWTHQFQFAGFYAAKEKGYYRAEGLEVILREAGPTRLPLPAVERGDAEFGVSDTEVFRAHLEGRPLVALGAIFQHSPNVILSLRSSGILRPADLAGRRVMFQGGQGVAEAQAMLKAEGLPLDAVQRVPHSWNLDDLVQGRVDAVQAYSTNEPYLLRQRGAEVVQLRPIEYGVDFYGDLLFTTRAFAEANPELVQAFARASFRGWDYAMEHPEEMIDRILAMPEVAGRGLTRDRLRFEAAQMRDLVMHGMVATGHMNPGRFRRIAEVLGQIGRVRRVREPEGFVYTPPAPPSRAWMRMLRIGLPVSAAAALLVAAWIVALRRTVASRTRALRDSERRLSDILDSLDVYVFIKDLDGRYTYANRRVCELFDRPLEAIVGCTDAAFFDPASVQEIARSDRPVLERGETVAREETDLRSGDGPPRTYWAVKIPLRDGQGRIYALCGSSTDITMRRQAEAERQQLQAQLHQAQKMESLGSLAGGVAHDMNNVLGAILGIASLHGAQAPPDSPLGRGMETIVRAAERGAKLVRGLLNFARQSPAEELPVDLNALLREEIQLLERTTLARIDLALDLDPALKPMRGDPGALTHLFMNLCVNAVDAMPGGGTLTLRTRDLEGDRIQVEVADTGTGMTEEVRARAFDPFFTTKGHGEGTGLGLAIVYSTVRAHQGEIELHSEPGRGSRFVIQFPADRTAGTGGAPSAAPPSGASTRRSLQVLLVDDDELVRSSIQTLLEGLGHLVTAAATGEAALGLLQGGVQADIAMIDMNMPGLGGARTLPRLRALRPELPVLLATGRADQEALDLAASLPRVRLLAKPFGLKELEQHLADLQRARS